MSVTTSMPVSAEWEKEASELACMRRMMEFSQGKFSLSIAVCNSPHLRESLILDLKISFPELSVCAIPASTVDVYKVVCHEMGNSSPAAIFLTYLEALLLSAEKYHPVLWSLNAARELFEERFPCPVVIWLPEYAVKLLSEQARDLWRYRSHCFEFVSPRTMQGFADSHVGNVLLLRNLSVDERRSRIAELERRLEEVGNIMWRAFVAGPWWSEIGFHHSILGNPKEAEQAYHRAIGFAVESGNKSLVGSCFGNLALIYKNSGKRDQAEELLRMLARDTGNTVQFAFGLQNLGDICICRGDLNQAESNYRQALQLYQELNDKSGVAVCLGKLGMLSRLQDNTEEAEALFRSALLLQEELGDKYGVSRSTSNLANIYLKNGDIIRSEAMVKKARSISEEIGDKVFCLSRIWKIAPFGLA